MSELEKNLSLLAESKNYTVSTVNGAEGSYAVHPNNEAEIEAFFDGKRWGYYMTGCYNSGIDCLPIDVQELDSLRAFCESLGGAE